MDGIELGNPGKLGPTLDQVPLGLGLKVGNPRYRRLYCGVAKLQLGPLNLGFRHGNSGPGGLESRLCPVPFAFTDGILLKQARDPVPLAFRLVQFRPGGCPLCPGCLERHLEGPWINSEQTVPCSTRLPSS